MSEDCCDCKHGDGTCGDCVYGNEFGRKNCFEAGADLEEKLKRERLKTRRLRRALKKLAVEVVRGPPRAQYADALEFADKTLHQTRSGA